MALTVFDNNIQERYKTRFAIPQVTTLALYNMLWFSLFKRATNLEFLTIKKEEKIFKNFSVSEL